MKKMQMNIENDITFSQGCDEYILDCKARNLRNGAADRKIDYAQYIKDAYEKAIKNAPIRKADIKR